MQGRALFLGVINIDMVLDAGSQIVGGKYIGKRLSTHAGGFGCIQSFGCSRCGINSAVIGKIGNDAFGKDITDTLTSEGIDISLLDIEPDQKTGVSTIIIRPDEPPMYLDFLGANFAFTEQNIETRMEQISSFSFIGVHVGMATVRPSIKLIEMAEKMEIPVITSFSTVDVPSDMFDIKPDYLVLNCKTASMLCNFTISDLKGARAASRILLPHAKKGILFQLDQLGTIVATKKSWDLVHPCHGEKITDPSGMTDCFTGVFTAQMIKGIDILDAAAKAHKAAMLCGSRIGVYEALPHKEELI